MCNAYGFTHPVTMLNQAFSQVQVPLIFPAGAPNLEARPMIRPTELAPVVRNGEGAAVLENLKWGFAPGRPKAPPVINFRSEGRRFSPAQRCIVPASWFYEYTGDKYPKTRWRFTLAGEPIMGIAGLWRGPVGDWPASWTMLTTEPGADVAPYHVRQVVALHPDQWGPWLAGAPEAELLRPLPPGSLEVVQDS